MNDMDHKLVFGIEPSFVILGQTSYYRELTFEAKSIPKSGEAKRDVVKNSQSNFIPRAIRIF